MEQNENQPKKRIGLRIAAWIQKFKKILIIVSAGILAVVIIIGLVNYFGSSKNQKANALLTQFEQVYFEWSSVEDSAKEQKASDLSALFEDIEKNYKSTYAYQRALFLMGDHYYYTEEWDKCIEAYENTASLFPDSYLAPISLFNAAAAKEEKGDSDGALENYLSLSDDYHNNPLAPRSMFSAGRLKESASKDEAITQYNLLLENYPQSNWTNLARNRIIELRTE